MTIPGPQKSIKVLILNETKKHRNHRQNSSKPGKRACFPRVINRARAINRRDRGTFPSPANELTDRLYHEQEPFLRIYPPADDQGRKMFLFARKKPLPANGNPERPL
jgi:hypothetical protein